MGWGTPDSLIVQTGTVRRLLVVFEIDRGNGDIRRGRTEVEWTGPMNNLADIEGLEALIGEGEGGIVAIFGWQQFED